LIIFIHGFKGTNSTFREFPSRLENLLTEAVPGLKVECIVFPAYETKGELDKAVVNFADWVTTTTVEREVATGLGSGSAKIVLCGHSMGGLLAADSLREFVNTRPDPKVPLWPKIIACIAFDTPYLGIHPFVVKNTMTKVAEYTNAATTISSALMGSFAGFTAQKAAQPSTPPASPSAWSKWAPAAYAVGGAVLAGAAAGGAYYAREDLTQGLTWGTDHLVFVKNLWDQAALEKRVDDLVNIEKAYGVAFRTFYTLLPPKPPQYLNSRTFIVLPKYQSRAKNHFMPANNGVANNEIEGHTGMFSASTNDGYYRLGIVCANLIRDAVMMSRGLVRSVSPVKTAQRRRSSATQPKETDAKHTSPSP